MKKQHTDLQVDDGEYLRKGNVKFQIINHTRYQVESVKIHPMLATAGKMKNVKDKERTLKTIRGKERLLSKKQQLHKW